MATAASLGIATMVVGSLMPLPSGISGPRALTQTRLTFDDGLQAEPSLSSDGSLVAFTADRAGNFDIWTQRIAGGDAVRVTTDPAHDWQPQWSPDDQTIVFRSERGGGGLYVVPATGGFERQISDFGYRPTWSADGSRILFRSSLLWGGSRSTLFVVGLRGESARQVDMTRLAAGESIGAFGWTPDGRGVALLSGEGPDFALTLVTVDLADGTVHRWGVAAGVQHAVRQRQLSVARGELLAWDARENALYFVGVTDGTSEVWAFNLDATRRTVANGPFRLSAAASAGNISLSSRGRRITFDNSQRTARIWLYPLGPNGRSLEDGGRPLTPAAMHAFAPDLAPDGAKMLFMWIHPGGSRQGEIVLRALADPDARTVSMHGVHRGHMSGMPFRWAPDGRRVAYMELSTGHLPGAGTAHVPSVSGAPQRTRAVAQTRLLDVVSGKDVPLTRPLQGLGGPSSWSPDGRYLITGSGAGRFVPGQHAIVLLPVAAAPEAERSAIVVTASAGHRLFQPNISPDGRWIAFVAAPMAAPHRTRIMVVRASGGTPSEWRALSDGPWDDKPRWAPDGRLLYFVSDRAGLNAWAVAFDGATGVARGAPFQVTHFRGPGTQILPDLHLMELGLGGGHLALPVVTPHGGVWLLDAIDVLAPSHQFARTMR